MNAFRLQLHALARKLGGYHAGEARADPEGVADEN